MNYNEDEYNKIKEKIAEGAATVKDYAWIYYHIFNWHILPGDQGKKHSYLSWKKDGHENKRYSWESLEREFNKPLVTNILLVTGDLSGCTAVDFDSKKEVSSKAQHLIDELPSTLTSITGSGGKHFFYKRIKGFPDIIGIEGSIDLRNDGLIVLPPSIHENGNKYGWEDEDELFS